MSEQPVKFISYRSLEEDGFQLDVPQGWEVSHSEPVTGGSYYFIPIGDQAGGFSVYRTLGKGDTADSRLNLESELTESLEVISRTNVQIDGIPTERLAYVAEEVSPRGTIIDDSGRCRDVGPERQTAYSDFVFLRQNDVSYVFGYKINDSARNQYAATLQHMLDSFCVCA